MARAASFVCSLALSLRGCVAYEYEHEIWIRVDGSGHRQRHRAARAVDGVQGRRAARGRGRHAARPRARLFEDSGPARAARDPHAARRDGPTCSSPPTSTTSTAWPGRRAFPDLRLGAAPATASGCGWRALARRRGAPAARRPSDGLMAVRFHLPSKVYEHQQRVRRASSAGTSWAGARTCAAALAGAAASTSAR